MDRNLLTAFALSMAVFVGWIAWQQQVQLEKREHQAAIAELAEVPEPVEPRTPERASWNEEKTQALASKPDAGDKSEQVLKAAELAPSPKEISPWSGVLENNVVRVEFSNRGAVVESVEMKEYFETPRHEIPVDLIDVPDSMVGTLGDDFSRIR